MLFRRSSATTRPTLIHTPADDTRDTSPIPPRGHASSPSTCARVQSPSHARGGSHSPHSPIKPRFGFRSINSTIQEKGKETFLVWSDSWCLITCRDTLVRGRETMAQYGGQYGDSDIRRQTDEFGNPVQQTGYGTGAYGAGAGGATGATGGLGCGGGQQQQLRGEGRGGGGGGVLQRSGSSGSSSSEDDGQGGRRKKGMKEKIKEKIPGMGCKDEMGQQQQQQQAGYSTAASGGYGAEMGQQQEKKGMMDKIKEKLPGHH